MPNPYPPNDDRWYNYEEATARAEGRDALPPPGDAGQTLNVPPTPAAPQQSVSYLQPEPEAVTRNVPPPKRPAYGPSLLHTTGPKGGEYDERGFLKQQAEGGIGAKLKTAFGQDPSAIVMAGQGGEGSAGQAVPLPGPGFVRGTPGTVIPGGRQPHSWAVTQEAGLPLTPEMLAEREAAVAQQQGALEGQGDAEREANRVKAEALRGQNAYSEVEQMAGAQRQKERDALIAQAKAKYDKVAEAANDPDHYWESKNGLSRVLAHIGIALGAFVQGWRGTPNVALQIINDEIDRDAKAQLRNLDKAGKDIQDLYAGFDDEDEKLAAAKAARRDWVANQLEASLENVRDAAQRAQIEAAVGKFREDSFNEKAKLVALMEGKRVTQQNDVMVAPKVVGGSPGRYDWSSTLAAIKARGGDLEQVRKDVDDAMKAGGLKRDDAMRAIAAAYGVTGVPQGGGPEGSKGAPGSPQTFVAEAFGGAGGYAQDPETARKKADQYRAYTTLQDNLTRMAEIRSKPLSSFGESNAIYQQLLNDSLAVYAVANGQGALSEGDRDTIGKVLGSAANDTFTFSGEAQLAEARNIIARRIRALDSGMVHGTRTVQGGQVKGRVTAAPGPAVSPARIQTRKPGER